MVFRVMGEFRELEVGTGQWRQGAKNGEEKIRKS